MQVRMRTASALMAEVNGRRMLGATEAARPFCKLGQEPQTDKTTFSFLPDSGEPKRLSRAAVEALAGIESGTLPNLEALRRDQQNARARELIFAVENELLGEGLISITISGALKGWCTPSMMARSGQFEARSED